MSRSGRKAAPAIHAAKLKTWGCFAAHRDTRPLLQGLRRLSDFYNPIHNPTTADTLQIPLPDTLPVTQPHPGSLPDETPSPFPPAGSCSPRSPA